MMSFQKRTLLAETPSQQKVVLPCGRKNRRSRKTFYCKVLRSPYRSAHTMGPPVSRSNSVHRLEPQCGKHRCVQWSTTG